MKEVVKMEAMELSSARALGVTTRDVAAKAGVAQASVSAVLNGSTGRYVSSATRQRILEAAHELGYRRNHAATAMRTGNTRMLGWIGGVLSEEHVGQMLAGALEAADAHGYTLKLLRLDELGDAQQVIRRASELRLMGVLALHLPLSTQTELHAEALCYGYPLVVMDGGSPRNEVASIASDDAMGIRQGVEHLVQLGHKRIGFISGEATLVISMVRQRAFLAAMREHGLEVHPALMAQGDFTSRALSSQAAHALLSLPPSQRPTAIVCSGDLIALSAMQVAGERGLRLPHELSLIGFANLRVGEFVTPTLTTIEQPFAEIGRTAVRYLLGLVEAQTDNSALTNNPALDVPPVRPALDTSKETHPSVRLPTRLIERASTAPPLVCHCAP